jgi:hypothetical protein
VKLPSRSRCWSCATRAALTVETPTPPLLPERPEIGSAIVVEPDHADHVVGPFTVTCACRALAAFVEGLRATPARRRTARAA